jgi:cation-transporting ATPase I
VSKDAEATLAATVADRTSMAYAGTTVVAGSATAVVVAIGSATEAGRSASMVVAEAPTGGVQARLSALTRSSIPLAAAAAATVLFGGMLRGRTAESVSSSVALAVAAIPEGLPFVATAAELSASRRLARHNVLVRRPRSIEAAGRVDVICFDKTGTLTEGRIQLLAVSDGRGHRDVADSLEPRHRRVLASGLRASPIPTGDGTFLHPTDQAVVTGAEDLGVRPDERASKWRSIRELPFESERGFHAVLGDTSSGHLLSVKGAPEIVLPRCVSWLRNGRATTLTDTDRRQIDAEVDRLAQRGLRVLAVAERAASERRQLDDDRVEGLQLYGLLGLADPTRRTAAEAVQRLRRAGIRVLMLTGDHPSTAEAIGAELDLLDGGAVVTGPELDDADDAAVDALVAKAAVFARVSPTHKTTVVQSLRRTGHTVAVTGDGANDAPAIRLADVGIALGDQGTDAARQAADMIVVDARLETIAEGILAGRAMWASVRDAVALLLGGNLGEILFSVASSTLSARPALNARQILFVNLMTDLLPALAVASRAPRGVSPDALAQVGPETSLGTDLSHDITRRAVATSVATAGGWLTARFTGTQTRASSVAVSSLVASQLAQTAVTSRGDPAVLAAVGLSAAALVATVQTPGLSQFFGSRPLGPLGWMTVLGAAAGAVAIAAIPSRHLAGVAPAVERLLGAAAAAFTTGSTKAPTKEGGRR